MTWVGGWVRAWVSSWKNFSQKEAELVLARIEVDGLTCYCEIEITNSRILGTLMYIFAYLFQVN